MAAERETSWAGISGLITTLLLAAGAVWVRYEPLETTRPPPPLENYAMSTERLQNVDTRLWQDPFAAVEKHRQDQENKAKSAAQPAVAASKGTPKVNPESISASDSQGGKDNKFNHLKSDLQRRAQ